MKARIDVNGFLEKEDFEDRRNYHGKEKEEN